MASISVWGKPLTPEGYANGDLLRALSGGSRNGFTPYKPPPIPSGYYDPNLDAQRQAASRGLLNTQQDTGTSLRRGAEDLGFAKGDINRTYDRGAEDIATSRGYEGQDYTTQTGYENQDYGRNVQMLTRQYGQQARQQAEGARKYGVSSGGIALLSAAKRNENQALDRQGLDTTHERNITGLDTSHTRAVAGFDTAGNRLTQDRDTGLSRATTTYDRGVADAGTGLSRAQSEDVFYGQDVNAQKNFQAQQAGYTAPTGPSNQFTRPDGSTYKVVLKGGYRYEYDPSGKVLNKRKA